MIVLLRNFIIIDSRSEKKAARECSGENERKKNRGESRARKGGRASGKGTRRQSWRIMESSLRLCRPGGGWKLKTFWYFIRRAGITFNIQFHLYQKHLSLFSIPRYLSFHYSPSRSYLHLSLALFFSLSLSLSLSLSFDYIALGMHEAQAHGRVPAEFGSGWWWGRWAVFRRPIQNSLSRKRLTGRGEVWWCDFNIMMGKRWIRNSLSCLFASG